MATNEASRPTPDNSATDASGWSSDLGDVDETGIDAAMRVAFDMSLSNASVMKKSWRRRGVYVATSKVQCIG